MHIRKLVSILMLVTVGSACERPAESRPATPATETRTSEELTIPEVDVRWQGICLAHSWEDSGARGYGTDASAEALDHLKSTGTNAISITPFGFMRSLNDSVVRGEHDGETVEGAETRDRLQRVTKQAHQRGFEIVLKPHIWIRGGEWRGRIQPRHERELSWDGWWKSYFAFILHYARLAEEVEIDGLVIGVELDSAMKHDHRRLIELAIKVRDVYSGEITYAANWNEAVEPAVWKALDSVGVQFYPPISGELETDIAEMRANLRRRLDEWNQISDEVDRPLILTEVGYRSANSAARHPSAWPEKSNAAYSKPDPELQAQAYLALFAEAAKTPRLQGLFVWKYFTDRHTDEEGPDGFSPRGKPAEDIIRQAYGAD